MNKLIRIKKDKDFIRSLIIGLVIAIVILPLLILGVRYKKYGDFIGKFTGDNGDYYQFNLFSWSHSQDGTNEQKCSFWNCNIKNGSIYYISKNVLHLRYDKHNVFPTKYKLKKKNNKTYLYFYNDSNELEYTYVKN